MINATARERRAIGGYPVPIALFLLCSGAIVAASAICLYLPFLQHRFAGLRVPVFLFDSRFTDFITLRHRFTYFGTLEFFTDTQDPPCMYPAPVLACYHLFFLFGKFALPAFLGFIVSSISVAAVLLGRALAHRGLGWAHSALLVAFVALTSWAVIFEFHQSNIEICVWVVLTLGIWSFLARRPYLAATCIGIAGAMKLFPFLLFGLMLRKDRWRQLCVAVIAVVAVTLGSLWWVYPNLAVSWKLTSAAVASFRTHAMLQSRWNASWDHSIWGLIKFSAWKLPPPDVLSPYLTLYLGVASIAVILLYFLRIRRLPIINQVISLVLLSILLPPTSFDYTLLYVFTPLALLFLYVTQNWGKRTAKGATPILVVFACALFPMPELRYHGVAIAGQLRCVMLVIATVLSLRYRFDSTLDQTPDSSGHGLDFSMPDCLCETR